MAAEWGGSGVWARGSGEFLHLVGIYMVGFATASETTTFAQLERAAACDGRHVRQGTSGQPHGSNCDLRDVTSGTGIFTSWETGHGR